MRGQQTISAPFMGLASDLLSRLVMKTRHALIVLGTALLLTPVVLSVGLFILIPVAVLLLVALPILGVAALPMLLVSAARETEPAAARAHAPMANTVAYST
jgi:hypothetical protein